MVCKMDLFHNAVNSVAVFLFLIIVVFYMKHKSLLRESHAPAIALIITEVILPAYLFRQLAYSQLTITSLNAVLALIIIELIIGVLSYLTARFLLKLSDTSLALFVLCSTFSSTGLLGNSFLKILFADDIATISEGILIGQLAITAPNYLLTPAILSLYSRSHGSTSLHSQILKSFLNPPNIAIICGLTWALLSFPKSGGLIDPVFSALKLIGDTIPLLVAITVGLSLNSIPFMKDRMLSIVCACFVLLIKPVLTYYLDVRFHEPHIDKEVSFLLAAMPAAPFIAVYAVRFNVNPGLASSLVASTLILSSISIPSLLWTFRSL